MAIVPGEKATHKRLNPTAANVPPLSLEAAVTAAAAAVSRARGVSVFLVLLRATTWILVKDGGEGAFRADDQCVEQLRCLPVLKIEGKQYLVAWAVDHVLVMNLKDWVECSLQLNWILNIPFHLIRKQLTHDNTNFTKLQSEQYGTGTWSKRSWEPDWFKCWCHKVEID